MQRRVVRWWNTEISDHGDEDDAQTNKAVVVFVGQKTYYQNVRNEKIGHKVLRHVGAQLYSAYLLMSRMWRI